MLVLAIIATVIAGMWLLFAIILVVGVALDDGFETVFGEFLFYLLFSLPAVLPTVLMWIFYARL